MLSELRDQIDLDIYAYGKTGTGGCNRSAVNAMNFDDEQKKR